MRRRAAEKVKDIHSQQFSAALGEEIRRRREGQVLTPRDLAGKAEIPYSSFCRYEAGAGEIRLGAFHRLCQALGAPMSDVLSGARRRRPAQLLMGV
jgi:transcriptional regulator with XRE-family HTH domain